MLINVQLSSGCSFRPLRQVRLPTNCLEDRRTCLVAKVLEGQWIARFSEGLIRLSAVLAAVTCSSDPLRPRPGDTALVLGGESSSIVAASISDLHVFARPGPVPSFKDAFAFDRPSGTLYITAFDNATPRSLVVINAGTLGVRQQVPLDTIAARSTAGSLSVFGSLAMAVTDSGRSIIIDGQKASDRGIVRVDSRTLVPVAFAGPFVTIPGGVTFAQSPLYPNGLLLLLGTRSTSGATRQDMVFVLDPSTLTVSDSFALTPPRAAGASLSQAVVASTGRELYLLTVDSILRFDLATRRVLGSTARRSPGTLCASNDGSRLYLTDPGDGRNTPGSGQVAVFDSQLRSLPALDLRAQLGNSVPPALNSCAPSTDDRLLLVSAGTASRGPLFEPQPGRLAVVDLSRQTASAIDLGDWSSREVIVP
jgi:DNA-binding beta-propeller fold protein YncE